MHYLQNNTKITAGNSRLARLGVQAEFKVGLVFVNFVLNRNINLNLVPNLAKRRNVGGNSNEKSHK